MRGDKVELYVVFVGVILGAMRDLVDEVPLHGDLSDRASKKHSQNTEWKLLGSGSPLALFLVDVLLNCGALML